MTGGEAQSNDGRPPRRAKPLLPSDLVGPLTDYTPEPFCFGLHGRTGGGRHTFEMRPSHVFKPRALLVWGCSGECWVDNIIARHTAMFVDRMPAHVFESAKLPLDAFAALLESVKLEQSPDGIRFFMDWLSSAPQLELFQQLPGIPTCTSMDTIEVHTTGEVAALAVYGEALRAVL